MILPIPTYDFLKQLLTENTTFADLQELNQELSLHQDTRRTLRYVNKITYRDGKLVLRKNLPLRTIFRSTIVSP